MESRDDLTKGSDSLGRSHKMATGYMLMGRLNADPISAVPEVVRYGGQGVAGICPSSFAPFC